MHQHDFVRNAGTHRIRVPIDFVYHIATPPAIAYAVRRTVRGATGKRLLPIDEAIAYMGIAANVIVSGSDVREGVWSGRLTEAKMSS